jgi:YidC/Oxa1 family membrane protein insertase
MNFSTVLYTLIIWFPRALIEFLFVLFKKILGEPGSALIAVSFCVNSILLPVYAVADKWQHQERATQKRMKPKLDTIRAAFKGDERQMIINAYYRQLGYSPLLALRSSAGLFLQVPFFLGAYWFLSHSSSLAGIPFSLLRDLGKPDALIAFNGFSVNLLPVLMTAVNLCSALVYTKDLGAKDKLQLYGIALLFLVLLYHSPSGLVLYWLCNNIFSLGKNLASTLLKRPARALQAITSLAGLILIAGALSNKFNVDRYRFFIAGMGAFIIAAPFLWNFLLIKIGNGEKFSLKNEKNIYFAACAALCLLTGLLIPAQVMAGDASDFAEPYFFITRTFVQSFTVCLFIPALIWAFASPVIRKILASIAPIIALAGVISVFALSASYGVMTNGFKIEQPELISRAFPIGVNIAALGIAIAVPAIFFIIKQEKILAGLFYAVSIAVIGMSVVAFITLNKGLKEIETARSAQEKTPRSTVVFPFTKTGRNTFVMFLDRAMGVAMSVLLEKNPALKEDFDGFTFYPNTLSFGPSTIPGLPPIYGGYDYTPLALNSRPDVLLADKANEALTVLPKLFGESGVRVSITDPALTNMRFTPDPTVFSNIPNVTARNIEGTFNKRLMEEFKLETENFYASFDFDILFRYSLFRVAPPALRYGIHYKGRWWRDGSSNAFGRGVTQYSALYYLADMCGADDGNETLSLFFNAATHEPGAYTKEGLLSSNPIFFSKADEARFGSEEAVEYMYTFEAALKAVAQWLGRLRAMRVYDNTRIIIVSDHGSSSGDFFEDMFDGADMAGYNPLLLVKDFGAKGVLTISDEFMTNADVPAIITKGFFTEKIKNPYLGTPLERTFSENDPLTVVSLISSSPARHGPYLLNITRTRALTGRDIFKASSWGEWKKATQR